MLAFILLTILAVGFTGLIVKFVLDHSKIDARITWREYGIGMAISPVLAVLITWGGWALARQNLITFTEYWNGWEVATVKKEVACSRDGPCYWDYDCDSYRCNPHDCNCTCTSHDKDGSCANESCDTCYDTCYHSCPYVTHEYNYYVNSTIGTFTIASNVFPPNPDSHRWRKSEYIPRDVIEHAGVGDPPFWLDAKSRCDLNHPGPVTKQNEYPNYILASDRTLMKEHSSDIEEYKSHNLLPSIITEITGYYHADGTAFIGWQPPNAKEWIDALEYLNAQLGFDLSGDLILVVVKGDLAASNPERYVLALKAFWQNKELFGKDSLPKNSIVIVLGTADGYTISWSRAFTAMPVGNEKLIVSLRDGFKGLPLTADDLIGPAFSVRDGERISYPPDGRPRAIQRMLWGMDDPETKFKRVSMSGKDGEGGYLYLQNEIQPTSSQIWMIFILTFFVSCGVWVWGAVHHDPSEE